MTDHINLPDNGNNVDWDAVPKLFKGITEDDHKGKKLLEIWDDFGMDPVLLLEDGNVFYPDRNSGINSITKTPPKDVDKFIAKLRKLLEV